MNKEKSFLEHKAYAMRVSSLFMTTVAGSGHPTSALSAADIVAALFFHAMQYDPKNPDNPNNDRFILSKGHASPIMYAVYKELGVLQDKDLCDYRKIDSVLEGHPTLRFAYTEAATGSLGMGLSIGAGMAYAAKMDKRAYRSYVLMGDSEITEGSIWEAAEIAAYYALDNLIGIVDVNRLGQRGETLHGHHLQRYADKFHAFGWHTISVDGHDMSQLMHACDKARTHTGSPTIILAETIKGYGVDRVENKNGYHGKPFKKEEINDVLAHLEERFERAATFDAHEDGFKWQPKIPDCTCVDGNNKKDTFVIPVSTYKQDELIATRKAYGQAVRSLGAVVPNMVCLDAEVSNSTYAELFAEKYPKRFIECFIAEQNMVSMAVGLGRRGKMPFVSTFGAFLTRAHDQLRMAAVGWSSLRIAGSHAGVSIGQDGPSQMALEDIAMMRSLPASIVLYPSDAVSTYALVEQMAQYSQGISYLRTTRMATPILYDNDEVFPIGGCKIVRHSDNDKACIVGAGVTLHEALKAHALLAQEGIAVAVVDLYSIKPLPEQELIDCAQKSGNTLITVEDHYLQGGMGQAVAYAVRNADLYVDCLAVTALPRSGKPDELLAWAGIDAAAIVRAVKKRLN